MNEHNALEHTSREPDWHDEDDDGYADYCAEMEAEPLPRAFCDNYAAHEAHVYQAINGNMYDCAGMTAEDVAEMEAEANRPPCPHGLSAALCAGPGHYPPD